MYLVMGAAYDDQFKLTSAARSAMASNDALMVKLILRRFPDNFNSKCAESPVLKANSENLKKLSQTINDPITYILSVHILFPSHVGEVLRDFQRELGIPEEQILTPRELKSIFSDRVLIQFILLHLDSRFPFGCNHDIHDKLMTDISVHKHSPKHLKLLKEVVRHS